MVEGCTIVRCSDRHRGGLIAGWIELAFIGAQVRSRAVVRAGRSIQDRLTRPYKKGGAGIDGRASGLQMKIGVEEGVGLHRRLKVHVAQILVGAVVPEQVVSSDGVAVHFFHRDVDGADEHVVEGDQIVPAGEAVRIPDESVVEEMNGLGDAGRPEVFRRVAVVHRSQTDHRIVLEEVVLDE